MKIFLVISIVWGRIRSDQGQYDEAFDFEQRVLLIRKKSHPHAHTDIVVSLMSMGKIESNKVS